MSNNKNNDRLYVVTAPNDEVVIVKNAKDTTYAKQAGVVEFRRMGYAFKRAQMHARRANVVQA